MARLLTEAVDKYGHAGYLAEIFGLDFLEEVKKPNSDRVRNWHQSLCEFIGGNNSITAFHLMMDLGLPCVKPDIVLTDLFYRLGWLSEAYQGERPGPKFAATTCHRGFTGLCNELRSTLQVASSRFLDPTQFVRWAGLWSNMAKSRNLAGAFAEI
jgi:hypothetical protein